MRGTGLAIIGFAVAVAVAPRSEASRPAARPPVTRRTAASVSAPMHRKGPTLVRQSFVVRGSDGRPVTMRATLAFSGDTTAQRPSPLVLSLHYSGPDTLPAFFGAGLLERVVLPALEPLGAVFVAPDAPDRGWGSSRSEQLVLALLDSIGARYAIDGDRTLVTGYSLGGMGTWYFAARHPERFRVAIPMASLPVLKEDNWRDSLLAEMRRFNAVPDPAMVQSMRRVAWTVLQSRADQTMSFSAMEAFVDGLKTQRVPVHFVALDSITHQQTIQYREPLAATLPWIRQQWGH